MKHTPGPWRWEINEKHKTVHLVGGVPQFDLTIIEPTRWGMHKASLMIRDTAHDGMNIMNKLHERRDWIAPFPGRHHHANWCADVVHPDMRLIAAAPELLDALQLITQWREVIAKSDIPAKYAILEDIDDAKYVIAKSTGEQE